MTSRLDGPLKVAGQAKYGADNNLPGTVYGYLVLSTIAHGEIESMEVTAAKGAPGVLGVYTPFDRLELTAPNSMLGETWVPLQNREVAYYGQPIGFVLAETFEQARDAAALVEVRYQAKPARTSFEEGIAEAEPTADREDLEILDSDAGLESIADAFESSPVVVDQTYWTATQNHAAMEPHSAVAVWEGGDLTLYTPNQASHMVASDMATALGVDVSQVHVVNPYVGGAFGGKGKTSTPAFLAAATSRVLGRPVKAVLTRE